MRSAGVPGPTTDEKYGTRHETPFSAVEPETVLAWSDYPADATRWTFEGSES